MFRKPTELANLSLMYRLIAVAITTLIASVLFIPQASAGNPHFVGQISVVRDGDSLIVSGKEAGLGNQDQVHIVVTADVQCVNPGDNEPVADNKDEVSAEGDFPVQNGKALFSLTLTPEFQPACSPPMTVVFSNVTVTDETHGITVVVPGTF